MTSNQIDTTQFNDVPVIRKLNNEKSKEADQPSKSNRGRKKKYNSPEERLAARRIQQKAYRERKKQQAAELKNATNETNEDEK